MPKRTRLLMVLLRGTTNLGKYTLPKMPALSLKTPEDLKKQSVKKMLRHLSHIFLTQLVNYQSYIKIPPPYAKSIPVLAHEKGADNHANDVCLHPSKFIFNPLI